MVMLQNSEKHLQVRAPRGSSTHLLLERGPQAWRMNLSNYVVRHNFKHPMHHHAEASDLLLSSGAGVAKVLAAPHLLRRTKGGRCWPATSTKQRLLGVRPTCAPVGDAGLEEKGPGTRKRLKSKP